jgi:hypothetical protein
MIIASGFQGRKSRPAIFSNRATALSLSPMKFSPAKPRLAKDYNVLHDYSDFFSQRP